MCASNQNHANIVTKPVLCAAGSELPETINACAIALEEGFGNCQQAQLNKTALIGLSKIKRIFLFCQCKSFWRILAWSPCLRYEPAV